MSDHDPTYALIEKIDLLRLAIQKVKIQHYFQIKAYVILAEHLHMIWELPTNDWNYSQRWKEIKALFSKSIYRSGVELTKTNHNEYRLWQRRYWEHTIKDAHDFENHVNYIHYNPIKHSLVKDLMDWPYSSFHHFLKSGRLSVNWCGAGMQKVGGADFGE